VEENLAGAGFGSTATLGCVVFSISINSDAIDSCETRTAKSGCATEHHRSLVGRGFSRDIQMATIAAFRP
jgi:hypothetical protein